jgi:WD40 repeat protein
LTGSADSTVRLWKVPSGEPCGPPLLHPGCVNAVAFSRDGRWVATAGADKTARLWDVATGKPVGMPLLHDGAVRAVAFSPDSNWALTGSEDRTARLWPLPSPVTGTSERLLCWAEVITGMELAEDGTFRGLDAKKFQKRRQLLEQLDGPPLSWAE